MDEVKYRSNLLLVDNAILCVAYKMGKLLTKYNKAREGLLYRYNEAKYDLCILFPGRAAAVLQ